MKKYKYLVVDYDGTLVNDDKQITPKTKQAIDGFIKRGGTFIVCTGRMTAGIMPLLKKDELYCKLMSYNGAEFTDLESSKTLFKKSIDNKTAVKYFKYVESLSLNVLGYASGTFITSQVNDITKFYVKMNKVEPIVHNPVSEYFEKGGYDTCKILVFDEKQKLDEHFEKVKNSFPELFITRSNDMHIDATIKGASKGSAIQSIAEYYGVTCDDIIAVGDAGNDVPMLEKAGLSVAMGNAYQSVKDLCDCVVSDNNNDGIKEVIEKYCI